MIDLTKYLTEVASTDLTKLIKNIFPLKYCGQTKYDEDDSTDAIEIMSDAFGLSEADKIEIDYSWTDLSEYVKTSKPVEISCSPNLQRDLDIYSSHFPDHKIPTLSSNASVSFVVRVKFTDSVYIWNGLEKKWMQLK